MAESVYIAKDGTQITYILSGNNCSVRNSYLYINNDDLKREFIQYIMDNNANFLTCKRSVGSFVREWKAHNILYSWGWFKKSTEHADLNTDETCFRRIGYFFITLFFKEKEVKSHEEE